VVLRDRPEAGTWKDWATDLHGRLLTGEDGGWADIAIEIAASLGVMMVVSGLFLAWPRRGEGFSVLLPNLRAKGRAFWKSTRRSLGAWFSLFLLFFLFSGLAWTSIWGGAFVQAWNTFQAEKWGAPLSDKTLVNLNATASKEVPFAPLPESGSALGLRILPEGTPVVLETVMAMGRALGFAGRIRGFLADPRACHPGLGPVADRHRLGGSSRPAGAEKALLLGESPHRPARSPGGSFRCAAARAGGFPRIFKRLPRMPHPADNPVCI
jgi:uncharacterized iron-regulated membrane protein